MTDHYPEFHSLDRGKVVIAPDFNEPLPEEVLNDFLSPLDTVDSQITHTISV